MILELRDVVAQEQVVDAVERYMQAIGAECDGTERNRGELRIFCYGP